MRKQGRRRRRTAEMRMKLLVSIFNICVLSNICCVKMFVVSKIVVKRPIYRSEEELIIDKLKTVG